MLGGTVAVGSGASLGGIGTLTGAVSIANGGTLLGQQGDTLTMGSLTLGNSSNVNVALGAPGNTLALFDVTGNLTLDGTLNVTDSGGFGAGVYRIFNYGGALTNNGMAIGTTPAGDLSIQTAIANQVNLVNTAGVTLNFWDGPNGPNNGVIDGVGAASGTTTNSNWTDADGTLNGPMESTASLPSSRASAAPSPWKMASSSRSPACSLPSMATQSPETRSSCSIARPLSASEREMPADATMTATIGSVLYGAGGLVKEDYGTLVLTGTKIYEGGTFVRGGVLQVAADTNLGNAAGGLVIDDATLRTTGANMISARTVELAGTQGTIDTADGARLTLSGTVSGAASLMKEGNGTLVLNGTNSYAGHTSVNAGTLIGNAGSIRGNLVNNGETVFDQAVAGTFAGGVDGSGLVIKQGDGELILAGNSSARWQVDAGMLASSALRFTGDVDIGAAGTMTFDQIANAGYGGTLSGSGTLLKTDSGLLELSADSGDFAGTTTVAAGTLRVTNKLGGTVAVDDGASLGGSGIGAFTGAVSIADGGTLLGRQGETLTMGSLTLER